MGLDRFVGVCEGEEGGKGLTWRVVRQSRGQRRHGGGLPAAGGGGGRHRKGCWLTSDFRNEHLWRPAGDAAAAVGAGAWRRRWAGEEDSRLRVSLCHFAAVGGRALSPPPALPRRCERGRLQHNGRFSTTKIKTFSGRP